MFSNGCLFLFVGLKTSLLFLHVFMEVNYFSVSHSHKEKLCFSHYYLVIYSRW